MIPVGPGGEKLSDRSEMILADALEVFKTWCREHKKATGIPPQADELAQVWGYALWHAYMARMNVEETILKQMGAVSQESK
jgi:NTP pyrophosphatase (non-canonical NTP hydrolase)